MSLDTKMKNFKVMFGLPTIDAKVDVHFMVSMVNTCVMLNKFGIQYNIIPVLRDCYVARARNEIVTEFLKSDYTHLFFVDADMGWEPKKVIKVLGHDKDIVFGTYPQKNDSGKYVHQTLKNDGNLIVENGLIKCLSGPTGFMCIKREVFKKFREKYPNYSYDGNFAYFHCSVRSVGDGIKWFGEDVDFCHKWYSAGGELWCEPDILFQHSGMKIWEGNYWNDLQNQQQKRRTA
jgi:hypothetical protein